MGTPNLMSKLNQASIQNSASNLAFSAGEKLRGGRGGRGEGGVNPRLFYKSMVRKIVKNAPVSSTCRKNQALVKKTSVETAVFLFIQFLNEKPGESS